MAVDREKCFSALAFFATNPQEFHCSRGGEIHLQRGSASSNKMIITRLYIPLDSWYILILSLKL